MDEIQEVCIVLEEGTQQTMLVKPLGNNYYRLASTPLLFLDIEIYWGDIIEAEKHEDGLFYLHRIVERAPLHHLQYILSQEALVSADFASLLKAIESCGGGSEIIMGGIFRCHIPDKCSLDIDAQLKSIVSGLRNN